MKPLLLALLLGTTVSAMAAPDYPDKDRFTEYNVRGTSAYVLVDNKTGCQYLSGAASASAYTLVEGSCTNLPAGAHK